MKKTIMLVLAGFLSLATYAQQTAPKQDSTKATHSCPMHPEITGTEKDKCSKCKMSLTPVKQYVCPMHADILQRDSFRSRARSKHYSIRRTRVSLAHIG